MSDLPQGSARGTFDPRRRGYDPRFRAYRVLMYALFGVLTVWFCGSLVWAVVTYIQNH